HIGRVAETSICLPSNFASNIVEGIKRELMPNIVRAIVQTRANDLASLLDVIGLDVQTPAAWPVMDLLRITHITHPSRLRDLRIFLQDDDAAFRHPQQALATEVIASKNQSILLIGPTGGLLNREFPPRN